MLEGLAVWALFIFLLRKIGMPWNLGTKLFAYVGGSCWLVFVWIGMISWSPMDMTGGAVVQSPHIQLRPESQDVIGQIEKIYVHPNQDVNKGDKLFTVDTEGFERELGLKKGEIKVYEEKLRGDEKDLEVKAALLQTSILEIEGAKEKIKNKILEVNLAKNNYNRIKRQSDALKGSVSEADLEDSLTTLNLRKGQVDDLRIELQKTEASRIKTEADLEKAYIKISETKQSIKKINDEVALLAWKIETATLKAPTDGFVTNFIVREGQFAGRIPRMYMYTNEKYVLLIINHQGIRNIKPGQYAEFATPVYPGKVFKGEVQAVVEATGESQGSLSTQEQSVAQTLAKNRRNKYHFVRIELDESEGYDIPLGSSGIGWVDAEKPHEALSFINVIRGIIIRMKAQIYYVYSL